MTATRHSQFSSVLQTLGGSGLAAQLLRGGAGGVAVKAASILLGMILVLVLARVLGAHNYGIYSYVFALLSLLAVPAQLGLPTLVVRETARAQALEHWALMRGIWRWSGALVAKFSLVLAAAGGVAGWLLADEFTADEVAAFWWGMVLIPIIALGNLRGAALRGLRRVVVGQLPEYVFRPALFLLLLSAAAVWQPSGELSPAHAMRLHVGAAVISFVLGALLLWRFRPPGMAQTKGAIVNGPEWRASLIPFGLISAMQLGNKYTDILLLGYFGEPAEVGIYRVTVQAAGLVAFGSQAVVLIAAPHFARLHARGEHERLQKAVSGSSWLTFGSALILAVAFIAMGEDILSFAFGPEYVAGYSALCILAVGRLLASTMGPVAILLGMSGHERYTAATVGAGAVVNIGLNIILIPMLGLNGAAISSALALVCWHVVLWHAARRKLGINTLPHWIR